MRQPLRPKRRLQGRGLKLTLRLKPRLKLLLKRLLKRDSLSA